MDQSRWYTKYFPIPYDASNVTIDDLLTQVDGVVFPSGGGDSIWSIQVITIIYGQSYSIPITKVVVVVVVAVCILLYKILY